LWEKSIGGIAHFGFTASLIGAQTFQITAVGFLQSGIVFSLVPAQQSLPAFIMDEVLARVITIFE
jgi:hypothetical protein